MDEELQMLMQQAGCDRETIIKALDKTNGDMAKAICWAVKETNMIHRINWPVSSIIHNRL